ncbi:hypothetical protein [Pasteurella multocida]|uniref:hypothetical protein n=1 Tax=Pasteurella multocida TaxID=747 RepID=UPI002A593E17|nr:hypothetical protein [Pasteurella multocida]MDY0489399.1 hypothetical protein [Pasteurella multocida]
MEEIKSETKKKKTTKKIERKLKTVEHFMVSYDASDNEYAEHKINANNLVKIIQDMITLVERSDKLLNGKKKTVELFVQAPDTNVIVKEGSIQLPFAIEMYEFICTCKNVVSTIETKDVIMALGLGIPVGGIARGVFKDIFRTKGEPVLDVKTDKNSDDVEVITENTKIKTSADSAILMKDTDIRHAIKNLTVAPLFGKADASFKIKRINTSEIDNKEPAVEEQVAIHINPHKEIETLTKLSESIVQEPDIDKKNGVMIMITQLNFYSGESGWKMRYDDKERSVTLKDEAFIAKINADKASFRKGDWLKVNLKIVKTFGARTTTSYIITKVIEHLVGKERKLTDNKDE